MLKTWVGFFLVFWVKVNFHVFFYLKAYYSRGQRSRLIFLFNTLSVENELKFHFRKEIKFRYQNDKKKIWGQIRNPILR
jgi:hypothetical protein